MTPRVECDGHGRMIRDETMCAWTCPRPGCRSWLTDEEVHRLLRGPGPPPPIIVIGVQVSSPGITRRQV